MKKTIAIAMLALAGCTPSQLAGLKTADAIAQTVCAVLTDEDLRGDSQSVLEAIAALRRDIVAAIAAAAEKRGDAEVVRSLFRSLADLAAAEERITKRLAEIAAKETP